MIWATCETFRDFVLTGDLFVERTLNLGNQGLKPMKIESEDIIEQPWTSLKKLIIDFVFASRSSTLYNFYQSSKQFAAFL
jgi:hypothetical protein